MGTTPSPSVPRPVSLEQQVDIETPEQVVLSYTVAGIGSRGAAVIIDYLIIGLIFFAIIMLFVYLASVGLSFGFVSGGWGIALLVLFGFAVYAGYFVLFEVLWDGQTPGKRKFGIRVVQDGGYSISVGASAIRNIARIIDSQPGFFYGVGIISAIFSKSGKRLGDILAGTFVVQERVVQLSSASHSVSSAPETALVTASLTEQEYELLDRFLARRAALDADRRKALAEPLVKRFEPYLAHLEGSSPMAKLIQLHERETQARARGVAARGATGAAREKNAIIAQNSARWSAFATAVTEAQRRGLKSMPEKQVSELVSQYREVATDLARLTTASRGRNLDARFYVSRLVGIGHNLLYRQRKLTPAKIRDYIFLTVPREIRRSAFPISLAALLLFGPATATWYAVVTNPSVAATLLPPTMIDRANEGAERAKRGDRTYVPVTEFERPVMASQIIANNIQVTYSVFIFGITAGIMTVLMLVFNGVSIGAGAGLYASKGIFSQIGEFVLPHSVFELSAICIAGGGGLLIASAILLPGSLTRREALVVKGRRAITLIAASTLLLLCAGTIEGLISPRTDIPIWVKFAIAGVCAVALIGYISLGWIRGGDAPESGEQFAYNAARALSSK